MPAVISAKLMDIAQADDPKQALIDHVGDLSEVRIFGENLLVASYIGPERTKGGVYRPKENIAEDEWQGKIGLVLKLGDGFDGDEEAEQTFLHRWVMFGTNDGLRYHYNGVACRTMSVDRVRQIIPHPGMVL